MFFVLSKMLAFLAIPSNIVLGIGILGMLLLLTRFRRAGVRLMVACLLIILVVGVLPIGRGLDRRTGKPLSGRQRGRCARSPASSCWAARSTAV